MASLRATRQSQGEEQAWNDRMGLSNVRFHRLVPAARRSPGRPRKAAPRRRKQFVDDVAWLHHRELTEVASHRAPGCDHGSCCGLNWRQVLRETTGCSQAEISRWTETKKPPGRKINLLLRFAPLLAMRLEGSLRLGNLGPRRRRVLRQVDLLVRHAVLQRRNSCLGIARAPVQHHGVGHPDPLVHREQRLGNFGQACGSTAYRPHRSRWPAGPRRHAPRRA